MTIKEVAHRAGVSISTVSRVLNNKNWVDPRTKEKVLSVVQELNFVPNGLARYLGGDRNETGIIGALFASPLDSIYNESNVFYEIINGIGDIADQHNKCLLLEHAKQHYQGKEQLPSMVKRNLVDGLIVGGIPLDEQLIRDLKMTGRPLVVIGKYKAFPTHRVLVDNFGGGYKATEHLIDEGYRRIAMVTGSLDIYSYADKAAGYKSAFSAHKRALKNEYIVEMRGAPEEAGYYGMERLMGLTKKPDAVFITDLSMTLGAVQYIQEHDIAIPDEIALVTYGQANQIKTSFGPLTYIHNGDRNIGHAAAHLLFDIIEGKASEIYDMTITTRLVLGKTSIKRKTGPAAPVFLPTAAPVPMRPPRRASSPHPRRPG